MAGPCTPEKIGGSGNQSHGQELLAELEYFGDSFWRNEEAGERRLQFFIALVTAVLAALAALWIETGGSDPGVTESRATIISTWALGALLVFGAFTLLRIMKRDCVTEEYKIIARWTRNQLNLTDPFFGIKKEAVKKKKAKSGGLAYQVALINGAIAAFLTYLAKTTGIGIISLDENSATLLAFVVFLVAVAVQITYSHFNRENYRFALEREYFSSNTAAGS